MTPAEAAALLTVAAAYDNRKPDADAAQAWALALDGLRFTDCREVIVAHYRASNEWIMPNHVLAAVKRLRDKRIAAYGPIEPPAGINPDDVRGWQRWLAEMHRQIAGGDLEPPPPIHLGITRDVAELGHVGREVPPRDTRPTTTEDTHE